MRHDDTDSLNAATARRLNRIFASKPDYVSAHLHSISHRNELMKSNVCGCFYCLKVFATKEIVEWVDVDANGVGRTAIRPKCGIDSVIGSASGYPITEHFLQEMHDHWF
jgi:hypothetical protein